MTMKDNPACLFIDSSSPEAQAMGLTKDSVISGLMLVTVYRGSIEQVLGSLSPARKQKLGDCLRVALSL